MFNGYSMDIQWLSPDVSGWISHKKGADMHHSNHLGCPPKSRAMHGLQWDRWPTIACSRIAVMGFSMNFPHQKTSTDIKKLWNGGWSGWFGWSGATLFHETIRISSRIPWKSSNVAVFLGRFLGQRKQLPPVVPPNLQDEGPVCHGTDHFGSCDSFGCSNLRGKHPKTDPISFTESCLTVWGYRNLPEVILGLCHGAKCFSSCLPIIGEAICRSAIPGIRSNLWNGHDQSTPESWTWFIF